MTDLDVLRATAVAHVEAALRALAEADARPAQRRLDESADGLSLADIDQLHDELVAAQHRPADPPPPRRAKKKS